MTRAYASLALVAALSVATPHDAVAICGRGPDVGVLPTLAMLGPSNTHVWIRLPAGWETRGICASRADCPGGAFELSLRRAPVAGRPPLAIPVTTAHSRAGAFATEELVPAAPLEEGTYEVWCVDRRNAARGRIVAVFRVGGEDDRTAPLWPGVKSAWYVRPPASRGGVIMLPGECGDPLVVLDVARAHDEGTRDEGIRYAVWKAAPGAAIDYRAPPLLFAAAELEGASGARIALGNTDSGDSDFTGDGGRPMKLGVRAVDLAGNASVPSEIVVR